MPSASGVIPATPQPSAPPPPSSEPTNTDSPTRDSHTAQPPSSDCLSPKPSRKPLLRLELRDLSSSGSREFLRLLHAATTLEAAVDTVLRLLYTGLDTKCIPPTRSVTLILRSMDGVAYTTGLDIDDDHKEIHFNTNYISLVDETRLKEEMEGVIVHEMVHCWQHNALGSAPGGLIEGIADWVRLKAGFAPPHWRRRADSDWDAGYERTGYFLEWLEKEHGVHIVRDINEALRDCQYEAGEFWNKCCGNSIEELWKGYQKSLAEEEEANKGKQKSVEAQHTPNGNEDQEQQQHDEDPTTNNHLSNEDTEDTRDPREKARRGGRMHIPLRSGPAS